MIYGLKTQSPCATCGSEDVYTGNSRVWCGFCHTILGEGICLGLIEGRHPMPVDGYLLPADMSDEHGFHQGAYDIARRAAYEIVVEHGYFVLYLTGLTVSALGAVDGMREAGISAPVCYNFDRGSGQYERIELATVEPRPIDKDARLLRCKPILA